VHEARGAFSLQPLLVVAGCTSEAHSFKPPATFLIDISSNVAIFTYIANFIITNICGITILDLPPRPHKISVCVSHTIKSY
jgi:hypothetical protein